MSYLKKDCCICDREINFYSLIGNQIQQLYVIIHSPIHSLYVI